MKHFPSESAIWQTISEFVAPNGEISNANGYEIIRQEGDICYAQGELYDNNKLINT